MTDVEKDKEQDKRLDYIDIELASIKSVTHGSEVHQWGGIVKEHKNLEGTVNHLKENSDYIAKFAKSIMNIVKGVSVIIGLVISIYTLLHFING